MYSVLATLDDQSLIGRFEKDIRFDAHSFTAKFERSDAMKEFCTRGVKTFQNIVKHMRTMQPTDDCVDLRTAWPCLLNEIGAVNNLDLSSAPQSYDDWEGWIEWAENQIPNEEVN